jgi:putative tricarboxylic transport membrane protein
MLSEYTKENGMRKSLILVLLVLTTMGVVSAQGSEEAKGAYPDRPVEFVAPASAGGGTDTFCRLIVDIINKNDLVDGNVVVVNKPGGGGTVGAAYAADKNRDGNYTLVALNGAQALGLKASKEVDTSDLVPIAALAMDNVLFVAVSDSPYKTFDDVIAAAKKNPGGISVGVADNLDRLCVEMINQ